MDSIVDSEINDFKSQKDIWLFLLDGGIIMYKASKDLYYFHNNKIVCEHYNDDHIESSNAAFTQPYMWLKS